MIALTTLALAAALPSVVDAERAFAASAQKDGQWTAFRATAAPDAVMFVPGIVNAQAWLKDRADPKAAIVWWPISALVSCDGTLAVSVGGWIKDGGRAHGTFTTVWKQMPGGWRWVLDQGHDTPEVMPRPEAVRETRASCVNPPGLPQLLNATANMTTADDVVVQFDNAMPATGKAAATTAIEQFRQRPKPDQSVPAPTQADPASPATRQIKGFSADLTMFWVAHDAPDHHQLGVFRWNGNGEELVRAEVSVR